VCLIFAGLEKVFASPDDPLPGLNALLGSAISYLRSAPVDVAPAAAAVDRDSGDVGVVTGAHYGRLFREFSASSFFEEPVALLRTRLDRNGIEPSAWVAKHVLDAGCGGGRYTVAWRMLGARHVVGVDLSATGISDARARVEAALINGVRFEEGDVLWLPHPANNFDVVFSNGVLHHSANWRQGVAELVRVLAPGGLGWIYLIENPGGYFWDLIEVMRVMTRHDDREVARQVLEGDGVPANRVFYMLDHVMVPINLRLTPAEVDEALRDSGAINVRRLTRGADFDRVEAIHRNDPFARDKYGVGENRFVFSK
jgi:SAM-dependent methyltransferase